MREKQSQKTRLLLDPFTRLPDSTPSCLTKQNDKMRLFSFLFKQIWKRATRDYKIDPVSLFSFPRSLYSSHHIPSTLLHPSSGASLFLSIIINITSSLP